MQKLAQDSCVDRVQGVRRFELAVDNLSRDDKEVFTKDALPRRRQVERQFTRCPIEHGSGLEHRSAIESGQPPQRLRVESLDQSPHGPVDKVAAEHFGRDLARKKLDRSGWSTHS